jgi:hypothetical protein
LGCVLSVVQAFASADEDNRREESRIARLAARAAAAAQAADQAAAAAAAKATAAAATPEEGPSSSSHLRRTQSALFVGRTPVTGAQRRARPSRPSAFLAPLFAESGGSGGSGGTHNDGVGGNHGTVQGVRRSHFSENVGGGVPGARAMGRTRSHAALFKLKSSGSLAHGVRISRAGINGRGGQGGGQGNGASSGKSGGGSSTGVETSMSRPTDLLSSLLRLRLQVAGAPSAVDSDSEDGWKSEDSAG